MNIQLIQTLAICIVIYFMGAGTTYFMLRDVIKGKNEVINHLKKELRFWENKTL